jgi:hypothetical protein
VVVTTLGDIVPLTAVPTATLDAMFGTCSARLGIASAQQTLEDKS